MRELFVILLCSYDGDSYIIENKEERATKRYLEKVVENEHRRWLYYHKIALLKVETGKDFGVGSRGDWYGGEVLREKSFEE
jgi:hypothetical protein